jgi:hypothetical protein
MHETAIQIVQSHIERNIPEYIAFIVAFGIAAVCTMPEKCPLIVGPVDTPVKQAIQDLWAWFRNALQTAIPAARNSNGAHPSNPTPPANPAQLKEGKQ